ncbi:MAG TPA: hypothetical protein VIL64_06270, partial [Solirubrobacteraceae bacterium]
MRASGWGSVLVVVAAGATLTACGSNSNSGNSGNDAQKIEQARQQGARQARQDERLKAQGREQKRLQAQLDKLRAARSNGGSSGSSGSSSSGGSSGTNFVPSGHGCGAGVSANTNTSCPFAQNVRDEYYSSGQSGTIYVYSPVTGSTYTMYCGTSGGTNVCTGGNNASVYFPWT